MVAKAEGGSNSFDLDLKVEEITLRQAGVEVKYRVYEASTDSAAKYRNALMAGITLGPEGKATKLTKVADVEPLLVALCIKEVKVTGANGQESEKAVTEATVRSWPARVIKALYKKVKDMSDLEEVSPEKQTLVEALQHSTSPISLKDFRSWVDSLPDEDDKYDYRPLKTWIKPDPEELAKNELNDTTAG